MASAGGLLPTSKASQIGSSYTYTLSLLAAGSLLWPGSLLPLPQALLREQSLPQRPGWQWQKPDVQAPWPAVV
jgi:hypothetical protein